MSQTENGLETIIDRGYPQQLEQYLNVDYLGLEEQRYATLILCNCLFLSTQIPPNQSLIDSTYTIMEKGEEKAI